MKIKRLMEISDSGQYYLTFWGHYSAVTECYYKGIDEMTLQAIIAHAKGSEITKKIYTHLRQDDIKVKKLEAIK